MCHPSPSPPFKLWLDRIDDLSTLLIRSNEFLVVFLIRYFISSLSFRDTFRWIFFVEEISLSLSFWRREKTRFKVASEVLYYTVELDWMGIGYRIIASSNRLFFSTKIEREEEGEIFERRKEGRKGVGRESTNDRGRNFSWWVKFKGFG